MHRRDWAMWLIQTAGQLSSAARTAWDEAVKSRKYVGPHTTAAIMGAAVELSYAYEHSRQLHLNPSDDDEFAATAHRRVAAALAEAVMTFSLTSDFEPAEP
jgi:hypothetical protein